MIFPNKLKIQIFPTISKIQSLIFFRLAVRAVANP